LDPYVTFVDDPEFTIIDSTPAFAALLGPSQSPHFSDILHNPPASFMAWLQASGNICHQTHNVTLKTQLGKDCSMEYKATARFHSVSRTNDDDALAYCIGFQHVQQRHRKADKKKEIQAQLSESMVKHDNLYSNSERHIAAACSTKLDIAPRTIGSAMFQEAMKLHL